jgi:8-oxo-dGTP diphosphatase
MLGQRISAGGIVIHEGKVLLVHHFRENQYDFWVMPGGRIEGDEGIFRAAEREVREETNLTVRAERIAYVEDFIDEGNYVCKFWVVCSLQSGDLTIAQKNADEDYLQDARFFSKEDLAGMKLYPTILKDLFWQDLEAGFPAIRYLGYRLHED